MCCPAVAVRTAASMTLHAEWRCGRADEVICCADEPVVQRVKEITGAPRASPW